MSNFPKYVHIDRNLRQFRPISPGLASFFNIQHSFIFHLISMCHAQKVLEGCDLSATCYRSFLPQAFKNGRFKYIFCDIVCQPAN